MKTIQVKVKPGSRVSSLEENAVGPWVARVKAPPVDGKANRELITLVARHFDRPKSAISIRRGASAKIKLISIDGAD